MRRRDFIKTAGSAAALGAVSHAAASTHEGEDTVVVEILYPAGKRLSGWEPSRAWRGDGLREEIA